MVRISVAALCLLAVVGFAQATSESASAPLAARAVVESSGKDGVSVSNHQKGAVDAKFFGVGGMPGPATFGAGFGGAMGFCQNTFLPMINNFIGQFGPGMDVGFVSATLSRVVMQFQLLVQYIQQMSCFTCGIQNAQLALFRSLAMQSFLRMQTLFSLTQQYYASSMSQFAAIMAPMNNLLPPFFDACGSMGLTGALAGNSMFSLSTFSSMGLTSMSSFFAGGAAAGCGSCGGM